MRYASVTSRLNGLGSDKWAVHFTAIQRARTGEQLVFLSIGEPDLPPPPSVIEAAVAGLQRGRTRYAPSRGEPGAVAAVAAHLTRRSGRPVGEDEVICVPGTQSGLYATINSLVEQGDEVLVPDPYYATYEAVVASSGATFVPVPTTPEDEFHLRPEALEAAITPRSRVLLLNSPSNPTGAVLSAAEVEAIGAVCERHDLWIVCDEVYADLVYGQPFVSPFDHPVLRERTITTASISKSHALPGLRVGWVAGPAEAMERVTLLTETMLFGGQPFLADALAEALDGEHPEVAALKGTFEARGHVVADTLAGSPACSTRVPEGGMFLMVDVRPTGLTGEQFAWRLLDEHHVVVMPGESFGSRGAGHVRIALTAEAAVLRDACTILRGLAESLVAEQAAQASA